MTIDAHRLRVVFIPHVTLSTAWSAMPFKMARAIEKEFNRVGLTACCPLDDGKWTTFDNGYGCTAECGIAVEVTFPAARWYRDWEKQMAAFEKVLDGLVNQPHQRIYVPLEGPLPGPPAQSPVERHDYW